MKYITIAFIILFAACKEKSTINYEKKYYDATWQLDSISDRYFGLKTDSNALKEQLRKVTFRPTYNQVMEALSPFFYNTRIAIFQAPDSAAIQIVVK